MEITAGDILPCVYRFLSSCGFNKTTNKLQGEATDIDFEDV